jgi:hypothetical protein
MIKSRKKQTPVDKEQLVLFEHLCEAFKRIGFEIRIEKGDFKDGTCIINGDNRLLFLNKKSAIDKHNTTLISYIKDMDNNQIYLPPLLRQKIEGKPNN